MPVIAGMILDVSGSMKESIGEEFHEKKVEWARSAFQVIDDIVNYDISKDNYVFAIGIGEKSGTGTFDILGTIKESKNIYIPSGKLNNKSYDEIIDCFFNLLEENGAKHIRKWASASVIKNAISYDTAVYILDNLTNDNIFLCKFVFECLPSICRDWGFNPSRDDALVSGGSGNFHKGGQTDCLRGVPIQSCVSDSQCNQPNFPHKMGDPVTLKNTLNPHLNVFENLVKTSNIVSLFQTCVQAGWSDLVSTFKTANDEDIKNVVEKAKVLLKPEHLEVQRKVKIFSIHEASQIIKGSDGENCFDDERIEELMNTVRPFIYGITPIYAGLNKARLLFSQKDSHYERFLIILSDGLPTDNGSIADITAKLKEEGITVISCFIDKSAVTEPKRLYNEEKCEWCDGAKFLFQLSSSTSTDLIPRTLFVKRDWKIDIHNNETKLFFHVNHPENIHDACDLAKNIMFSQDSLSDILTNVSLEIYINQSRQEFTAKEQEKSTCYANAAAAVLHLAMKRIIGRVDGYPEFNNLRSEIIHQFGSKGANTLKVLEAICPSFRLRCERISMTEAMIAITAKRPVVATFRLTEAEWDKFSDFYDRNPTGILTKKEINIRKRNLKDKCVGHAVVLTSFNSKCLRFMNSWGDTWADMGFFRVQNSEVLDIDFIDVFWTLDDLFRKEKDHFKEHGPLVAENMITNLKGLQNSVYECPLCWVVSPVSTYSGTLIKAVCPNCNGQFRGNETGNILALNIYLTSLAK